MYIIFCEKKVVYIGIAKFIEDRIRQHISGVGASITKQFKPVGYSLLDKYKSEKEAKEAERDAVIELRNAGYMAFGGGRSSVQRVDRRRIDRGICL